MMPRKMKADAPTSSSAIVRKHLICGAGGSRAILGSAGAIYACDMAGIKEWETLGGVSGGSIPTVLLAGGYTPAQLLKYAVELDFSSLVVRHATPLMTVVAFLLKDRFEYTRPRQGVLSSDKLGSFINEKVPVWPKNYWTMAVVGRTQIVFTADGVYQYLRNGHRRVLSNKPADLGIAVRATCAVPGIIDAVPWDGRYLFDGALSWDGQCPIDLVARHFGATHNEIIGCDVGEEPSRWEPLVKRFWALACGGHCISPAKPADFKGTGVLMMQPAVESVRSLQFTLTVEQKWLAVQSGFCEAVDELEAAGILTGDKLKDARLICKDVNALRKLAAQ